MDGVFFELPVGLSQQGNIYKNVELLRTNGVAEKVFLKKLAEKPFTWQGNVVSIAVKSIGPFEIGSECRQNYLKDNSVTIPQIVRNLTLADINTLMVEIHRRCWVSFIPKQEVICKYCGKRLVADIDLDKIDYFPETKEQMEQFSDIGYSSIEVNLKDGFIPPVIPKITDQEKYQGITEQCYNRFVFRPPLLQDAIKHEAYFSDTIGFWRRIAIDCLTAIQKVNENGCVVDTLPIEFHTYYGLKMFNEYLTGIDLRSIRTELTEHLPTLPYAYYEPCGCEDQKDIPMIMEASSFFSE